MEERADLELYQAAKEALRSNNLDGLIAEKKVWRSVRKSPERTSESPDLSFRALKRALRDEIMSVAIRNDMPDLVTHLWDSGIKPLNHQLFHARPAVLDAVKTKHCTASHASIFLPNMLFPDSVLWLLAQSPDVPVHIDLKADDLEPPFVGLPVVARFCRCPDFLGKCDEFDPDYTFQDAGGRNLLHIVFDPALDANGPSHLAREADIVKCVGHLIDKGVPVDEADERGDTPAILAAKAKNWKALQSLLEAGALLPRAYYPLVADVNTMRFLLGRSEEELDVLKNMRSADCEARRTKPILVVLHNAKVRWVSQQLLLNRSAVLGAELRFQDHAGCDEPEASSDTALRTCLSFQEFSEDIFDIFIGYCETGILQMSPSVKTGVQVCKLAEKLDVRGLQEACLDLLEKSLTMRTIRSYILEAMEEEQDLDPYVDFCVENFKQVSQESWYYELPWRTQRKINVVVAAHNVWYNDYYHCKEHKRKKPPAPPSSLRRSKRCKISYRS